MEFTNEQLERYSRHLILKEIGAEGQKKLCAGSVLVAGSGGPGVFAAAMYLAGAGVGRIGLAGSAKALAKPVKALNPDVEVILCGGSAGSRSPGEPSAGLSTELLEGLSAEMPQDLSPDLPEGLPAILAETVKDYDFVIDCGPSCAAGNVAGFAVNDACAAAEKPFVHAEKERLKGRLVTVIPGESPCLRCVFRNLMPLEAAAPVFSEPAAEEETAVEYGESKRAAAEAGIAEAMDGLIGSLEALEAVKYLTGAGKLLAGKLLTFDALAMDFETVTLPPGDRDCCVCSGKLHGGHEGGC